MKKCTKHLILVYAYATLIYGFTTSLLFCGFLASLAVFSPRACSSLSLASNFNEHP